MGDGDADGAVMAALDQRRPGFVRLCSLLTFDVDVSVRELKGHLACGSPPSRCPKRCTKGSGRVPHVLAARLATRALRRELASPPPPPQWGGVGSKQQ